MTPQALAAFALLLLVIAALPSRDVVDVARFQSERGFRVSLPVSVVVLIVRLSTIAVGIGVASLFVAAMPDGLMLARYVAGAFLLVSLLKRLLAMRKPLALADNDNMPERSITGILRFILARTRFSTEFLLGLSLVALVVPAAPMTREAGLSFGLITLAVMVIVLAAYTLFSHQLLTLFARPRSLARKERIEKLLSSGLPRVSARFRRNAA
ncbi:hypothetical protein FJU08_03370 [Martelella alba]|uniref:Uncharacterized protein n=1 Tax=Martelella alba TaxID=2590451 RepID=A0A506UJX3_9HYPH|nr:hypothetical protein [Martelella alba]TPW33605.1 hypothetical protein FJU08_03370 [Martelella alba]